MNIIFLDIDGVLNSLPYCERVLAEGKTQCEIDESKAALLAQIVQENNAKLVLSSTWKSLKDAPEKDCQDMWSYLVNTLAKYELEIYDTIPNISGNRPHEISIWLGLQLSTQHINWISLEDDFHEQHYHQYGLDGHLIQTSYFVKDEAAGGLLEEHVALAKDMFESQQAAYKEEIRRQISIWFKHIDNQVEACKLHTLITEEVSAQLKNIIYPHRKGSANESKRPY